MMTINKTRNTKYGMTCDSGKSIMFAKVVEKMSLERRENALKCRAEKNVMETVANYE